MRSAALARLPSIRALQGGGVGRRLMEAVLERANGAAGIRLLQDAFNMRSLALYASLGFEVREPVLVMTGRPTASRRRDHGSPDDRAGPGRLQCALRPDPRLLSRERTGGCRALLRARWLPSATVA